MNLRTTPRLASLLLFASLSCTGQQPGADVSTATNGDTPSLSDTPRLVVLCSVDQLASWVWREGLPHFADDGGFKRILREGVNFTNCAYEHGCTETGPGHATIGTGAPAAEHGIVRNNWWSPAQGAAVYCVGHLSGSLPGMLVGRNRGADRLLAETLADVMRAKVPGCKIGSVAWKDRSAILMVGKHADVAAWFEVTNGDLVTNTTWCSEVPAWIAAWNIERIIDKYHGYEWARIGPESAYAGLVDNRPYEMPHLNGTNARTLPQLLTGGKDGPDIAYYNQLYYSPIGNEVVRLAAQACIEGMDLGADETPDLLAVGFSSTDTIGHHYGPDSIEARDALLRLDRQLGQFLTFLDQKVGKGRYALFLTADHGVGPTPEWRAAQGLAAGRGLILTHARSVAEVELTKRFGQAPPGTRYCAHLGEWTLVFDRRAFLRGDGEEAALKRFSEGCDLVAAAITQVRGITAAYTTRDILDHEVGDDPYRLAFKKALHPGRTGDIQLVSEPYWLDGVVTASHGTPHAYDREVVGLAMGPGIASGIEIADAVTPGLGTVLLAELLGIPAPAQAVDKLPADLLISK